MRKVLPYITFLGGACFHFWDTGQKELKGEKKSESPSESICNSSWHDLCAPISPIGGG